MTDNFNQQFPQVRNSRLILVMAFSAPKKLLRKTKLSTFVKQGVGSFLLNDKPEASMAMGHAVACGLSLNE